VLTSFDEATGEHLVHTYDLLRALAARVDLFVIAERSAGAPAVAGAVVYRQRWSDVPPLRLAELIFLCVRVRMQGCRRFFVRYSYFGVFGSWLVTRALGGRVYYWHCTSTIFRARGWTRGAWRHRLRAEWPLALTMKLIDTLVTGTPTLAAQYSRTFRLAPSRIRIVPNDIDITRFQPNAQAGDEVRRRLGIGNASRIVLFVHRIVERKGAHYVPAIARIVCQALTDARFVLVGDGPARSRLIDEVNADAILHGRVAFVGSVPNRDIKGYYAAADVLLMPSEEEGFPRVLLEAMATGTPIVAADVGGVRDVCVAEQHEFLVPVGDVDRFASSLLRLLSDAGARERLRAIGLQRVQQYSTGRVLDVMLQQLAMDRHEAAAAQPGWERE
jgi:glycosyltransferase involved in cell wall biosynthesis